MSDRDYWMGWRDNLALEAMKKLIDDRFLRAMSEGDGVEKTLARVSYAVATAMLTARDQATVPDDVREAVERMCKPLDESILHGATAQEDARCMRVIRDYVLGSST